MMQTTTETINIFSLYGDDVLAHKINQNVHKQIKRKSAKSSLIQFVSVIGCDFVKVYYFAGKERNRNRFLMNQLIPNWIKHLFYYHVSRNLQKKI